MKKLTLEAAEDTPKIVLDADAGVFEISGRSLPEDAAGFYQPVIDWIQEYGASPNDETNFQVKLEYFNTASSKLILDILTLLEDIDNAKVTWYYYEDDEDMQEAGEEFSEIIEVDFDLKPF